MSIYRVLAHKVLISFLALSFFCVFQDAHADELTPIAHCDITDVQIVDWAAMKQKVELTTQIKSKDGELFPLVNVNMRLADGTDISLAENSIYKDSSVDCSATLFVATYQTIESLEATPQNRPYGSQLTLDEFDAKLALAQDCLLPAGQPNKTRETLSDTCQKAANLYDNYIAAAAENRSEWPNGRWKALIKLNAPLIYVGVSDDVVYVNVYDPIDKVLRYIMTEGGC